ncbi:MAG: hypothetical protein WDM90_24710 [Ferruginibacter sp.]
MGWKYIQLLFAGAFLLAACSGPEKPVTKDDAITFAKEIESSVKKGDPVILDNAIDKKEFTIRMDLPNTNDAREFGKGVLQTMKLGTQMTTQLSDADTYNFIKYYVSNGKHHIVFRALSNKDEGLNYQDYELIMRGNKCMVADAYMYSTAENLSETVRTMYNMLYGSQQKNKIDMNHEDQLGDLKKINDIKELYQKGRSAEAKQVYLSLPDNIKRTKLLCLLNVYVSAHLSADDYNVAVKEFERYFPNEPNLNLIKINGYYLQKDYAKMLEAVNALDAQINKDPLLDYQRYLSYDLMEQKDSSRICLQRLIHNMPDFQKGFIELIAVDLKNGYQQEADSVIALYRKKTKFDQERLDKVMGYYKK